MTTYTKLRDGSWGVKGKGLVAGSNITVTKKSGESKVETIDHILWTGTDGSQLASIRQTERSNRKQYSRNRYNNGLDRNGECHCDMCSTGNECLCRYGNG